ncbi:MAG: HPr family phosphocarrier protein [Planctomycetota bacterium]|nr:HPr family phosphocarrier protein [Planctomycetota bacterium]
MELRRKVRIVNTEGLHARPCHAIVSTALEYGSSLEIRAGDRVVNGKSILELMTLKACFGTELEILARGEDAQRLVDALVALIGVGFGEEMAE